MQCLLQKETTSFHPHRLKTRHMRVSGVYSSRLKTFLTTELREKWLLRIINITGSHAINYSVNSVFFSLFHASKVTNTRTNMQVPYMRQCYDKHVKCLTWCLAIMILQSHNTITLPSSTDNNAVNTAICFSCTQYIIWCSIIHKWQWAVSWLSQTDINRVTRTPIQSKSWAERDHRMIQDMCK